MSWFTRSIANSLRLDDDDDEETNQQRLNESTDIASSKQQVDDESPLSPGRGVKEDLSEITKTLARQFWGVASFLAPPPPSDQPRPDQSSGSSETSDPEASLPEGISGIRQDFAEIGGRFRSGISKLSNNIDVTEITKLASNFLQLGREDESYDPNKVAGAIGVTDEVVAFVKDIAMHPETWLDFPLPEDEDDDDDFELSDAQQEHALAVESLAPRLAALRIELCPGYMSEGSFWKIYFVLLHPRLEHHDAELLSTPEIVKARASLTYVLKNRSNIKSEQEGLRSNTYSENIHDSSQKEHLSVPSSSQSESVPLEMSALQSTTSNVSADMETEKSPIPNDEIQIVDKSVIQEEPRKETKATDQSMHSKTTSNIVEAKDEDDADDWLKEESSGIVASGTTIPIENDEDVSFSDLEDEDDGDVPSNDKKVAYGSDSSTKDSRDWVQLGRSSADSGKDSDSVTIERAGSGQVSTHNSETKESNDWLDVDDIDVA